MRNTISQRKADGRSHANAHGIPTLSKTWFLVLALAALTYAVFAGLKTVTDWDLGWQMATGRWVVQHHQIPSIDVLSYTAYGKPWKYPIASGLIFYLIYLAGNYTWLSILGAFICASTVALLLRRGSWVTAALAIAAIPTIAIRTTPRAEIFTVLFFAAFLTLLWEQHETGRARLWLLPLMMVAWVNLHLGLTAGLGLFGGYVVLECLDMVWPGNRVAATDRLRRSWPWFLATACAMMANPWGWGVFGTALHLMSPMTAQSQKILEWAPAKLNWITIISGLSVRNTNTLVALLLVVAIAIPVAIARRQLGAVIWLSGAALEGVRHQRLQVFFSIVVVVVAGSVLTSALASLQNKIRDQRLPSIFTAGAGCFIILLVCVRSNDLVTNRTYMQSNSLASFGTGLSWWFPEGAAAFIERQRMPGRIFNTYDEGGYITWRLGQNYQDYVDGRGDPFGATLIQHSMELTQLPPDSPDWQREAERYGINAIIVQLGRYWGVDEFPLLRQFCSSQNWRPMYLDETSVVFVRRTPANGSYVASSQIDCDTAPIPAVRPTARDSVAFHKWANATAVLKTLGRIPEALTAASSAIAIFPDSAYLRLTRGDLLESMGDVRGAEQEYLASGRLQPSLLTWTRLAQLLEREHRLPEAIHAWEQGIEVAPDNASLALLSLGFDYLDIGQPREALNAFHRSQASFQEEHSDGPDAHKPYYANLSHGQAVAYEALRDIKRAISFEEETVRLAPERQDDWLLLGKYYDLDARPTDAERARNHAAALNARGRR